MLCQLATLGFYDLDLTTWHNNFNNKHIKKNISQIGHSMESVDKSCCFLKKLFISNVVFFIRNVNWDFRESIPQTNPEPDKLLESIQPREGSLRVLSPPGQSFRWEYIGRSSSRT